MTFIEYAKKYYVNATLASLILPSITIRHTVFGQFSQNMQSFHVLPCRHLSPNTPTSHPFRQVPFTWWHCSPLLQLPQVWPHSSPYILLLHALKKSRKLSIHIYDLWSIAKMNYIFDYGLGDGDNMHFIYIIFPWQFLHVTRYMYFNVGWSYKRVAYCCNMLKKFT